MSYLKSLKDYKPGDDRRKLLPFTQTKAEDNTDASNPDVAGNIEGYAAGLLNIDRGQDIIFPGAFKASLPSFLEDGVVCYQHDWTASIGKPTFVEERLAPEYGLFTNSEITATTLGTDVMKLVRRSVLKKLSIGYRLKEGGYSIMNRETLVATLKDRAIEQAKQDEILTDFDKRKLSEVFGLFDIELFEYSVVTRPMNPNADITGAKGLLGDGGGELLDGCPFSVQPLIVLDAIKRYKERLEDSFSKYSAKERGLSATHREGIVNIRQELELLLPEVKRIEGLLSSSKADRAAVDLALTEFILNQSKGLGINF